MRILLINYRYFVSGGPERYMFNVKDLLEEHGHEVIPFSIAYEQNESSPYASYFAPPLSDASAVYFREHSATPRTYLNSVSRAFYSPTVYRKLATLIADTQPDVALVLHYLRKLSPAVLKCLADHDVPFAVRLSDFAMVCPNAHLIRDGQPCELCVGGSLRHSVRYACVQGSHLASAVNYAATRFHRQAGYYELIRKFVVPSRFTMQKMVEGGWETSRFAHIPTFVRTVPDQLAEKASIPTIAYAGRLEPTKGLETLLAAIALLERDPELPQFAAIIAGGGSEDYTASLRRSAAQSGLRRVQLAGALPSAELASLLARAWVSVVPSLWYENMPNAALESMANGTAVIASGHGSLPEIVEDGRNGLLTPPGDPSALAAALKRVLGSRAYAQQLGEEGRRMVAERHSPEGHYELLMDTFSELGARDSAPAVV